MDDMNIQAVEELLSLEFYRFKRYKVPITLVLIVIDNRDFFATAEAKIRKTDLIQQIDKNLYAILYSHTDAEGARAAIDNILETLGEDKGPFTIAVEEADYHDASEHELIARAFGKL